MPIENSSYNEGTMHHGFQSYTASVSSSCWEAGADLASSWEWCGVATANDAQHPHTALASTCVRLTVTTTYVQIDAFLQANLYLLVLKPFIGLNNFLVNKMLIKAIFIIF